MNSDPFRQKLTHWGEQIYRVFTSGSLSFFAGTGISAPRESHLAASLNVTSLEGLRDARPGEATFREQQVLDQWLASKKHPLLVLAPFGTGKSVLLSSFTITLAKRLARREGGDWQVPVPVRLREWVRFRAAHSQERATDLWVQFLLNAIRDFTADPDIRPLTLEEFMHVKRRNDLVLLLDGFDELPASSAAGADATSRAEVLELIRPFAPQFVLTSRNYYEAERDRMFSTQDGNILNLQDLDRAQILEYISRRFARSEDEAARQAAISTLHLPALTLEGFLGRPLFLAAWCEQIPRDGSAPSTAVYDIMLGLFAGSVRQRQHTLPTEAGVDAAEILRSVEVWAVRLGQLLCAFAHARYADNLTTDAIRRFQTDWVADALDPDLSEAIRVAVALGLLVRVGAGAVWCPKVPLAEFLTGAFLASLSRESHGQRKAFLALFRRWVYRPETFDTLEFAFDRLADVTGATVVEPLLDWMCRVSDAEPHRSKAQGQTLAPAPDDLVRPAAWLAFRLAIRSAPARLAKCAESCALAVIGSTTSHFRFPPTPTVAATIALVEALARRYAASTDDHEKNGLLATLRDAGYASRAAHAAPVCEAVMEIRAAASDREFRHALHHAANYAGICVPQAEAQLVAERLIARHGREEPDENNHTAPGTVAMLIPGDRAAHIVERWVRRWRESDDERERSMWEDACRRSAISVEQAEQTARRWLGFALAASASEERSLWCNLALHAATQSKDATTGVTILHEFQQTAPPDVRFWALSAMAVMPYSGTFKPGTARAVAALLLEAHGQADDGIKQKSLRDGLAQTVGNFTATEAEEAMHIWLNELNENPSPETRLALYAAIGAAAGCLAPAIALTIADKLISLTPDHRESPERNEFDEAWQLAVVRALKRVDCTPADALIVLHRWLHMWANATSSYIADALGAAIKELTRRLEGEQATRLTEQLIVGTDLHPDGDPFPFHFIENAARRVQPDAVAWTFARWLKLADSLRDADRRFRWRAAALAMVDRVTADSAPQVLEELVRRHGTAVHESDRALYREAISRTLARQPREGESSTPHALQTLLALRSAADSPSFDVDEREYWDAEIKALLHREFEPVTAKTVCGILLSDSVLRPGAAIRIAIHADAFVLWEESENLTVRDRGDDRVLLDPHDTILNGTKAKEALASIRALFYRSFSAAESYTPDEQYERLKVAIRRLRPDLTGYPDGPKGSNKRNAWLDYFRNRLKEGAEMFQEPGGVQRWIVLKNAFDRLTDDEPTLVAFINSRDSLKPKRPK